jgi:hypothetical protein
MLPIVRQDLSKFVIALGDGVNQQVCIFPLEWTSSVPGNKGLTPEPLLQIFQGKLEGSKIGQIRLDQRFHLGEQTPQASERIGTWRIVRETDRSQAARERVRHPPSGRALLCALLGASAEYSLLRADLGTRLRW